jgi:hypothetical protein
MRRVGAIRYRVTPCWPTPAATTQRSSGRSAWAPLLVLTLMPHALRGVGIRGQHVDAARVSKRERRNVTTAGQLRSDEVLPGDTGLNRRQRPFHGREHNSDLTTTGAVRHRVNLRESTTRTVQKPESM